MLLNCNAILARQTWICAPFMALTATLTSPRECDAAADAGRKRPNILWITCEDMGAHVGCYGDSYAITPNLDRLAARSLRYTRVWSNAPVCAPARTTLITGMYPTSTGSEHMRSLTRLPAGMKFFPQYLREAGYYCTNNSKEDYNLDKPGQVWDESSNKAHYRQRGQGQPFFAVFNFTTTHESQIRKRPHQLQHDPAGVRVPKYHPDLPEVRHDWAQYYDNITTMDGQAGRVLEELEKDGLADDTIVFFFSDHGSGMPRNKRWPYNCGLHVPLLVHIPEKWKGLAPEDYRPGGKSDRLVAFVDFGPTILSLAGIATPDSMQGAAFLGAHAASPHQFLHGFRGRMDERIDMVRSVCDARYVYVRNYMPHLIYGQHLEYMFETPTTPAWQKHARSEPPDSVTAAFWRTKPPEELYDLDDDPDEVHNLAGKSEHAETLQRLRREQEAHIVRIRDVGFLSEHEIHARSRPNTPFELGHDASRVPIERIAATAGLAASLRDGSVPELRRALRDSDGAVRYWGALGHLMRGRTTVRESIAGLREALQDRAPDVQIVAAEALLTYGDANDRDPAKDVLLRYASFEKGSPYLALAALNAVDRCFDKVPEVRNAMKDIPTRVPAQFSRPGYGIERLVRRISGTNKP